ncbi:unnamed protein product [Eruca vesicaria subsp. sativa]|uniref:Uncharacterized protein n=1 Tax=Eruca vesicaria subsp. sativa TaxID=29727 RepID=A0ABC8K206_ERUVS|nr:unnamed protein product [Eruca vesicaria subsp. sativa]
MALQSKDNGDEDEEDEDEDLSLRFAPTSLKPTRHSLSSLSSTGSNRDSKPPAVSFLPHNRSPSPPVNSVSLIVKLALTISEELRGASAFGAFRFAGRPSLSSARSTTPTPNLMPPSWVSVKAPNAIPPLDPPTSSRDKRVIRGKLQLFMMKYVMLDMLQEENEVVLEKMFTFVMLQEENEVVHVYASKHLI